MRRKRRGVGTGREKQKKVEVEELVEVLEVVVGEEGVKVPTWIGTRATGVSTSIREKKNKRRTKEEDATKAEDEAKLTEIKFGRSFLRAACASTSVAFRSRSQSDGCTQLESKTKA